MAEFCVGIPRVQVELELSPLPLNIAGTTFDIAIRVGTLQDSRLTAKRLCRNRRIVCAAPDYLDRHGTPTEPKDLQQHNCIVLRENEGDYALWRFGADNDETADPGRRQPVLQRWRRHHPMVCGRTRPDHALDLARRPTPTRRHLVQVLADLPTPSADIHALYLATAHPPRRIRELVNHLADRLAERIEPF